ncbi:hypothetical protein PHMEG_00032599 [Phytophthora megakarya]|uniref:Pol Polyprotein n=1 Tax=Phytophthora megakarya TaxID=4795 RepID=A0A225UVA0_9STRA|nr:hypothetical protein PHMEG_00032599 [Phytophthora megakarya]
MWTGKKQSITQHSLSVPATTLFLMHHLANYLSKRRFDAILADNDRENDKRLEHFYQLGEQVMVRVPKQFRSKLRAVANGLYTIRHIHQNGAVTIDRGSTTERLSIRRIFPC